MKIVKEINPKWNEYYVAEVSIFNGNPIHRMILRVLDYNEDKNNVYYEALTYEDKTRYNSNKLNFFELVERIDMKTIINKDELFTR